KRTRKWTTRPVSGRSSCSERAVGSMRTLCLNAALANVGAKRAMLIRRIATFSRMRRIAALLLTLPQLTFAATHTPAADTWMQVLRDGNKIGAMHSTRSVRGDEVVTTTEMNVELVRTGTTVALSTREVDTETRDGKPLAFETRTAISGIANVVRGRLRDDGRF